MAFTSERKAIRVVCVYYHFAPFVLTVSVFRVSVCGLVFQLSVFPL